MPATLTSLLADSRLGLRLLTDHSSAPEVLARPIRWVATSELADPTPYLQGGELLLTTGLGLPRSGAALRAYAQRLVEAGVVGLGYGVGLVTDSVPARLLEAAGEQGLPMVEVDQPTPFIAISKAVADVLAADQVADLRRGFTGQQALTRAAVTGGPRAVLARLATTLHGWAALLDADGGIRHLAPASARAAASAAAAEVGRLRRRRPAAASVVRGDTHLVVQSLAHTSVRRGFLAAGTDRPPTSTDRSLLNVAAALLSVDLEQTRVEQAMARTNALVRLVLEGACPPADLLADLGGALLTRPDAHVVVLTGEPATLTEARLDLVAEFGDDVLTAIVDGALIAVTATARERDALLRAIATSQAPIPAGTSHTAGRGLVTAIHQARQAATAAVHLTPPVLDYAQLSSAGALRLIDPPALSAYSDSLLAPLDEYAAATGIDLVGSVAAWLSHHGQYDPAAAELGVHRHTLRYRLQKAETLLGRDLSTMDARMELWLAIRSRHRPTPSVRPRRFKTG